MRLSALARQTPPSSGGLTQGLRLPSGEVHIWWVGLHVEGAALCACWDLLSPEETRAASSYRFVKDLREFVVTRAVLRQILARYTGQSPSDLRFESGSGGKPVLQGTPSVHFSVSHCSDIALLAVARVRIGIDVEYVRPGNFWQKAIGHCLTSRERAYLEALPIGLRPATLYRFWTRKEAILKAMGTGLLYPPQQVTVLPEVSDPAVVSALGSNWLVRQVPSPDPYAAAVAIEASACKVKWRQWRVAAGSVLGAASPAHAS